MGTVKGYMDGIDIASYQKDIDIEKVPSDFVITKATQGSWYTNPYFEKKAAQTRAAGKHLGIYHYSEGTDYKKEVDFLISKTQRYMGKALFFLDWEGQSNKLFGVKDVSYCKSFMDYFYQRTGIRMILYVSKSVLRSHNWESVEEAGYAIWPAQYKNNNTTGYQEAPWTDDKGWGAWTGPAIYQYSSHGRLSGYSGNLDINKACITGEQWDVLTAPASAEKEKEIKEAAAAEPRQMIVYLDPQQMMETLALAEVGYQEKASSSRLYSKHTNVGTKNYTKYNYELHKIYPSVMDYPAPYCDAFYDWICYTLFGIATAKSLLKGNFDDYTVASARMYEKAGAWHKKDPQWMDQIFFSNNGQISGIYHTGAYLYTAEDGSIVTVESNTSGSAGVVADGGQTAIKSYKPGSRGYSKIAGYGRPDWKSAGSITKSMLAPAGIWKNCSGPAVRCWQALIGAAVDGHFGDGTEAKTRSFQKAAGLQETGSVNDATWAAGLAKAMISTGMPEIERGSRGNAVRVAQAIIGADADGDFGPNTDAALKAFQKAKGLATDGCAGANTWKALLQELR